MDEYISREEAVKKVKSCIFTANDAWESGYNTAMAEIMEQIKRMPTADVQPVKHGRWTKNIRGDYSIVCSECGYGLPLTAGYGDDEAVLAYTDCNRRSEELETTSCIQDLANYCPYCGAKMDLKGI